MFLNDFAKLDTLQYKARRLIGATNPCKAEIGTIRGDFGQTAGRNIIHGADSVQSAAREIALWFSDTDLDLIQWESALHTWTVDTN